MSILHKTNTVYLFFSFFILTFIPFHHISAEPENVLDCFENDDTRCEEITGNTELDSNEQNIDSMDNRSEPLLLTVAKLIVSLLLILFLIYIMVKFLSKRNRLFHQASSLENLGGIPLGQNKSIQIIRVGKKLYLIGVGENINLLEEIKEEGLIRELLENQNKESKGDIFSVFQQSKTGGATKKDIDFKQQFNEELSKLKQTRKKIISKEKEDKYE